MAPKRNKREADYSNVGVAGRKTGITLKDTGVRDEHGLEPIEGIFSSPQKSPPRQSRGTQNSTITEEEDMDVGESTIPDPTEVLTAHRTRNGKPMLPPPRARSPIKTSLGSSPRRSVGAMSSPLRRAQETPTRALSHPPPNKRLDFSMEEARASTEKSPRKRGSLLSSSSSSAPRASQLLSVSGKGNRRPFNLTVDEDEEENDSEALEESAEATRDEAAMNGNGTFGDDGYTFDDTAPLPSNEDFLQINGDESLVSNGDGDVSGIANNDDLLPLKPKRGRHKGNGIRNSLSNGVISMESDVSEVAMAAPKRKGRPPKTKAKEPNDSQAPTTGSKRKLSKTVEQEVQVDGEEEMQGETPRPAKRAKGRSVSATPSEAQRKGRKPPPAERDPNARITSAKGKARASPVEIGSAFKKPPRPKPRNLQVLRSETPAEDEGAHVTRSGRTSVKPIAYWRNEQLLFDSGKIDGSARVLPGIREVIRTKEIYEPRPKVRRAPGRSRQRSQLEDLEEEDEDQEAWELEEGVFHAEVMQWDPVAQRGDEQNIESLEIAYAPLAIKAATREVKGAKFRYAKTLGLPFFGSGMVELPPGGEKRVKNSRRMQMVFVVLSGRIEVMVAGSTFSLGKGGMWQVPRGNFYGIANHYQKPAQIFFAQGNTTSQETLEENGGAE